MNTTRTRWIPITLAVACAFAYVAPAAAAPLVVTSNTPNIKWTTSISATLVVNANYDASGNAGTGPGTVYTAANGGTGTCTAPGSGFTNPTVDFGTISPDATTLYTDCLYKSALDAQVATNSSSWTLQETIASVPATYVICALPNGAASWPFTPDNNTNPYTTVTAGRTSAVAANSCPTMGVLTQLVNATAFSMATGTAAYATSSPAHVAEDIEIVAAPNAAAGSFNPTLSYTLTAN